MRYKLLGRSGLRVSELALGTMTFGPDWGWGADADESRRIFARYDEAGGNFVDTVEQLHRRHERDPSSASSPRQSASAGCSRRSTR